MISIFWILVLKGKGRKLDWKASECGAPWEPASAPRRSPVRAGQERVPGTCSFWKVRCFTADADREEAGCACGRRAPRSRPRPVAGTGRGRPALAWRLCVAPRQAWGGHQPRSRGLPSRSLPGLAFLNTAALRLRKGAARPVLRPEEKMASQCGLLGFALVHGYAQVCVRSFT